MKRKHKRIRDSAASIRIARALRVSRSKLASITVAAAVAIATLLTFAFARGLPAGDYKSINTIGRIEVLRMPIGARRLVDVKTFTVTLGGADDYGRVYVNNHLIANREAPSIFYTGSEENDGKKKREQISMKQAQRNVNMLGSQEMMPYLHTGTNFIVVESENAIGPCVLGIEFKANGVALERSPVLIPDQFKVDKEVIHPVLLRRLKVAEQKYSHMREFAPTPYDDVVCGRRVFQIELD